MECGLEHTWLRQQEVVKLRKPDEAIDNVLAEFIGCRPRGPLLKTFMTLACRVQ